MLHRLIKTIMSTDPSKPSVTLYIFCQMQFYGVWAWVLITHVSVPLLVCYRFQATVCFYEIWKNCYKKNKDKDDTDIEDIELKNHVA